MSVVRARSGGQPGLSTTVVRGILQLRLASASPARGELGGGGSEGLVPFLGFYNVPCAAGPSSRAGPGARDGGSGLVGLSMRFRERKMGPGKRPVALSLSPPSSRVTLAGGNRGFVRPV